MRSDANGLFVPHVSVIQSVDWTVIHSKLTFREDNDERNAFKHCYQHII